MGAPAEESWLLLPLSLAAKYGASHSSSLLALLLLLSSLATVLHWLSPGGPAWGRYWWAKAPSRKPIPGPRGLPFLGSIRLMRSLPHRQLAAAADRLGARRLMAFSLGETRAIVTADPAVAKEILTSSSFADRPIKESAYGLMFHRAIGFAPYGAYWRTLRRISSTHLFCPKQIATAAATRQSIADEMLSHLGKFSSQSGNYSPVLIRDTLKCASLSNIMWSVFGRSYDFVSDEAKELRFLVEEGYDLLGKLNYSDHIPIIASLDFQGIRRRCSKLIPRVNRFVGRIIDEHRDNIAPVSTPDFVDVLLSLQGDSEDSLSDSDMAAVLWEMVFRGADTVAVLIEWVLARLVMHEDVQKKVQGEIDKVVGRSKPMEERHVAALPYLNAVIKEVIRLHPPGPLLSWARLATSDTIIDGSIIPAGTTAMVNMWAITHDPEIWPQPEEFLPERFMQEGAIGVELSSLFGSDLRLAPFGSGRRSCPGKALAMATVGYWVAALLHEFEWLPQAPEKIRVDLSEVLRLSCEMAFPLAVRLRRRRE